MRWPGKIPAGATNDRMLMTIDLLPTLAGLIGASLPSRAIDGRDVKPILLGDQTVANPHPSYAFYFEQGALQAITSGDGRWKVQLPHQYRSLIGGTAGKDSRPGKYAQIPIVEVELYDLQNDVGETTDVAKEHPEIVRTLLAEAESYRVDLGDALTKRIGSGVREPGRIPETSGGNP